MLDILRLVVWASLLLLSVSVQARLDLNYTVSQQCTPLNVTWTPIDGGYPYVVWIMGNRGFVDTYLVNSNYPLQNGQITFQFAVPPPTSGFNSYVVAVADSKGNGNTTRPLGIATPSGSSSSCDPFTATASWTWAADSQDMSSCSDVKFYNIGDRGTRPFYITYVPIQGNPITVSVPNSYTTNTSTFVYHSIVPFASGTQFQIVLGDASGFASGGASQIYTAASGGTNCLQSGYTLADTVPTRALLPDSKIAVFRNLPGAISTSAATTTNSSKSGGGGGNVGAIAGGAIGGAIALGVAIGCLIAFLLFRKRQKLKRDQARREEDRFVDLDGDEDGEAVLAARSNRRGDGVTQSYAVSPFVYQSAAAEEHAGGHQSLEMTSRTSRTPSVAHGVAMSQTDSHNSTGVYGDLLTAAGVGMTRTASDANSHSHAGGTSSQSHGSQQPMLAVRDTDRRTSQGSTMLRLTNDDADLIGATATSNASMAGPLPSKGQISSSSGDGASARRVIMHSDGGPLPQPTSDDEDEVQPEELPPQYGGWLNGEGPSSSAQASGSSAETRQT